MSRSTKSGCAALRTRILHAPGAASEIADVFFESPEIRAINLIGGVKTARMLAKRAGEAGIVVHQVARFGLRGWAALAMRRLIASRRFELLHLNEPHSLTAAWMARAHKRVPLLLSRRIGFPLQKNAISQARFRTVARFVANSKDVAQSLLDSGVAAEQISIVNEGVKVLPLRTAEQRRSARKHWGVRENEFLFGCVSVFVPEKGQRHLIEALPLVRALHPEARL